MLIALGLLFIGIVVFQYFIGQVWIRIYGPFGFTIERDEWPAFYWGVMGLESVAALFMIYLGIA